MGIRDEGSDRQLLHFVALGPQDDVNAVAVKQIESLLRDEVLPFGQELRLLRADSSYGKAIFLAPLHELCTLYCP